MNIVCIGGGPAGLYAALLLKKQDPARRVVVLERDSRDAAFGWGLVFSDRTLQNMQHTDSPSAQAVLQAFNHWEDIDIHFKGQTLKSGGHGFCGIARKRLLAILRQRCEELGAELHFDTEVADEQEWIARHDADLLIACDGLHSRIRNRYAAGFAPSVDARRCRYVWLGTRQAFPAFTFAFEETPHGWFQMHAYQYDGDTATVIVEAPEDVWQRAGLERLPGAQALEFCNALFAPYLGGHPLLSDATQLDGEVFWSRFPRIHCRNWVHWLDGQHGKRVPLVLMGDAAHSAHFSIGSGTRLALEDAIELAQCLTDGNGRDLQAALDVYQSARALEVRKMQSAAANSMEWFENVERYAGLEAPQFAYSLLTRSQRLSHESLRQRDPAYVAGFERWFARRAFEQAGVPYAPYEDPVKPCPPPMFTPFRLRDTLLKNRVVVSPMAQYSAVDGAVGDYHLVHLGSRAMGGAALVFAEMTAVSADARITPGCAGLYCDEHTQAWRRIVDFIHSHTDAKVAIQLGHAGPKGSTRRAWEGMDLPLENNNWPLVAASAQQYLAGVSAWAQEVAVDGMARIRDDFVRAAKAADAAGFDWLELHCAHGYLLSTFLSPLTNRRGDDYGGSLEKRCRYPLEVFAAVRAVWPQHKPISIRISAHDWVEGGMTPDDAVQIARLFREAGADMIDCSSGQVSKEEKPAYGRMYQTPFADSIRQEAGLPTIAVGAIDSADQVNSIIGAGRADLCAIARPHLADAAWTLHQAAATGYREVAWPQQYESGKAQFEKSFAKKRRE